MLTLEMIKLYICKMISFDEIAGENKTISKYKNSYHFYRILIAEKSGKRKANALLNLIKKLSGVNKTCPDGTDKHDPKYRYL